MSRQMITVNDYNKAFDSISQVQMITVNDYNKAFDSISQVHMYEIPSEWAFQNISSLYWKRFTMTSQLSLDVTVSTLVHSILREE